ncbi:MAG: N-acetyl-gamma-glutamyl-phosphate reductase [Clostridia bacterium]|nr:N-acetyl-gamma-glutamyl-phosphate reductase [Clostridia bacterium]
MKKIFIDGKAGTTGLKIFDRLKSRNDIEIITLSEQDRKSPKCRKEMLNKADIAFLCLPDDAAIEAVSMIENPNTVVIDTSTAHRTNPNWVYAFPELSEKYENSIKSSKRIAVPGCHASGFIALVYPLIESDIIDKSVKLTCHSVTGYSGGGKKMIKQYESEDADFLLSAPRQYGLTQNHKHLREMKSICGLENAPIFCPIVSNFYSGMVVTVPLFLSDLKNNNTVDDIKSVYKNKYGEKIVRYTEKADDDGMLSAAGLSGKDGMEISVFGNEERILLTARYDNLLKGASGAAIEALNIVLEKEKTLGLNL